MYLSASIDQTSSTFYNFMDNDAIAHVVGAAPDYEVLYLDIEAMQFKGVVAIDNEGYPVWYHDAYGQVMGFDKFDDHTLVYNTFPSGMYSALKYVTPTGEDGASEYIDECEGTGYEWTQVNHEARATSDGNGVLTVQQSVTTIPGGGTLSFNGAGARRRRATRDARATRASLVSISPTRVDPTTLPAHSRARARALALSLSLASFLWPPPESSLYLDDAIAYLDRTTGELTSLVSLSSYFDPVATHVSAPNSYTTEKTLMCSDSVAAPWTDVHNVSDWSHMSSVSEGTDVYVVALRNLDAVLAFYKAGSGDGLAWMISSNRNVTSSSQARGVPSFTFESHLHRFYNPHDAQLIEETDAASGATTTSLLLFDDGNNRRGCDEMDEHCYSRAVKYSLDFETYAATLTWQFAWPSIPSSSADEATAQEKDIFSPDGGSVVLHGGKYYVGYTYVDRESSYEKFAYVFEVTEDGDVRSQVKIKRYLWEDYESGLYRTVPFSSIFGESSACPFASLQSDDDDSAAASSMGSASSRR